MSTIGDFVVPLAVDVTTANILNPDIRPLTYSSLVFSLPSILYMVADLTGYDDKNLYGYSKKTLGIDLVCPVERYEITSKKRLEIVYFYQSVLGQTVYKRGISIYH
jgi:hypothetical protein